MPTDTLYALTAAAQRRGRRAPRLRHQGAPGGQTAAAVRLRPRDGRAHRRFNEMAAQLASRFWPGQLTIVVPSDQASIGGAGRRRYGRSARAGQCRSRVAIVEGAGRAGHGHQRQPQRRRRPGIGRRGAEPDRRPRRPDPGRRAVRSIGIGSTIVDCSGDELRHPAPGRRISRGRDFACAAGLEGEPRMRIAIGSDHAGFQYKSDPDRPACESLGHEVKDFGTDSEESVDYPDYIRPVARGGGARRVRARHRARRLRQRRGNRREQGARHPLRPLLGRHDGAPGAPAQRRQRGLDGPARRRPGGGEGSRRASFLSTDFEGGRHVRRIEKIEEHDDCSILTSSSTSSASASSTGCSAP